VAIPVVLAFFLFLFALKARRQDDADQLTIHGYSEPVPVAKAIADFNARARLDEVGHSQPPLAVTEFLAAVRGWNADDSEFEPAIEKEIRHIATAEEMPKGSLIRFTSGSIDRNGFDVDVWFIELQLGLDRYPADLADSPIYLVQIRTNVVASRPTAN